MPALPRVLFFEGTRVRIEFERGYKYSHLLIYDACRVFIRKFPTGELARNHTDHFCERPIDPRGVEKAVKMFLASHYITDRAKEKLEEIRMTVEIEKADEPIINGECVKMIDRMPEKSKLRKVPKKFKTRELALEHYNAMKQIVAEQEAAAADARPEDSEQDIKKAAGTDSGMEPAPVKKGKRTKSTPNPESEATEMATKKKATKKAKKASGAKRASSGIKLYDDTRVKAVVKLEDVVMRAESKRTKVFKKIAAAGARGITLDALKDGKGEARYLIAKKYIAIVK